MNEQKRQIGGALALFAAASMFMGLYGGFYSPSFNNYLAQVFHVGEVARGWMELPREMPGFLVVFLLALLARVADTRIALVSAGVVALALFGQGFLAPNLGVAVVWMFLWSAGAHLYMVIAPAIGLRLAREGQEGTLLGKLGLLESLGTLPGMALLFLGTRYFHASFGLIFGAAAFFALAAALLLFRIKPRPVDTTASRMVFKRGYGLYYWLNILFGARKQVFLTFAPWVLIKIFHADVSVFAILGLIGTGLSLGFRPLLGKAIDIIGERRIIAIESVLLVGICVLYGFAQSWFPSRIAMLVIMACYIIDQLLMAATMARVTYIHRTVHVPGDLAPTLSMGMTLDHAVSMLVPILGGLIWAKAGYPVLFLAAAGIALVNLVAALRIPDREPVTKTSN